MTKRALPIVLLFLIAATAAHAQGGGHGHGGQGPPSSGGSPTPQPAAVPPPKPPKPENQIELVGVVQAIDPAGKRLTITYEANEELNWPRGTNQFGVYAADLLKGVTVGERVRFKLDDQQIAVLSPY
jgi:Copper binding periplasmic protein CusF